MRRENKDSLKQEILQFITEQVQDGIPPTVREIGSALGIKSTSTVHKYLVELEEEGYIQRGNKLNRAIRLNEPAASSTVQVPLLGTVAAGEPILAIESVEDYIPFAADGRNARDYFALRVKGESMINAAILDGDIIVSRRTSVAENGEIVVALVDDSATVKRFYKEKGHFRLQPENDTMDPILVDDVSMLGKVVAVIRNYES